MSELPALDLRELRAPFPASAIKTRKGGGGINLRYVEGHTIIHRLNNTCPAWDFQILREWQDGNHLKAHVRLTIPGLGSREHIGVQVATGRPGTEDVDAKGHITDALKKAATLFGVGLELYGPDYEASEIESAPPPRPIRRQQGAPPVEAEDPRTRLMKAVHAAADKHDWTHEDLHRYAAANFNAGSMQELGPADLDRILNWFEASKPEPIKAKRDELRKAAATQPALDGKMLDWETLLSDAKSKQMLEQVGRDMAKAGVTREQAPTLFELYVRKIKAFEAAS